MKAIDLFAGIGGFHYAAKANQIDVVFASEIDKIATAQYELNHGLKPHGDITKVEVEHIPNFDLLMAGFPCQAFSIAGKRKGFEDTRGTLFFEIARILKEKAPACFILENVPALLSHDKKRTFFTMEKTLQELGYYLHAKILNAKDFGVPQSRNRLFIVGFKSLDNFRKFRFPSPRRLSIKLKDILEENIDKKYFVSQKMKEICLRSLKKKLSSIDPEISPTILAKYNNGRGTHISEELSLKQIGIIGKGNQGSRIYDIEGLASSQSALGGGLGAKTGLYLVGGKNGEKASQRVYSEEGLFPSLTSIIPRIQVREA